MTRLIVSLMLLGCVVATLYAEETRHWIRQWNHAYNVGEDPNDPYIRYLYIDRPAGNITIYQGIAGATFHFEARKQTRETEYDPWEDAGPGNINFITATTGAGDVAISVIGYFRDVGAQNLGGIDLDVTGVNGDIAQLELDGNLGHPLYPISARAITSSFRVIGAVVHDIDIERLDGNVMVGSMLNFTANLATIGDPAHTGSITINGPYDGNIHIGGAMDGTIQVRLGDMSGQIVCTDDLLRVILDHDLTGDLTVHGDLDTLNADDSTGNIHIGGILTSSFSVTNDLGGSVYIGDELYGNIFVHNDLTAGVTVAGDLSGNINIYGSMYDASGGQGGGCISVDNDLTGNIAIDGDLGGAISVVGNFHDINADLSGGHIIVDGSFLADASIDVTGQFAGTTEYIVIDSDGWDEQDSWVTGATVTVDSIEYTENTPAALIWETSGCKGDMNNSGELEQEDYDSYTVILPGLTGSHVWRGDVDCSGVIDAPDIGALLFFLEGGCCLGDCALGLYEPCRSNICQDGTTDLDDLSLLLSTYGLCEGDPDFNAYADFDNNGCVELSDMSFLLAYYGLSCECFAGGGGGGEGMRESGGLDAAGVAIVPRDTGGQVAGDFRGEVDHFVFDLVVELVDDADDWTSTGVELHAAGGAVFRLAPTPTTLGRYATFVTSPLGGDDERRYDAAQLAGAYQPAGPEYTFEPETINLTWFDRGESHDGPAGMMRLVIDVSAVAGADVSSGFGSVYFSTTGPENAGDIQIAALNSETCTAQSGSTTFLGGHFYVKGQ